MIQLKKYDSGIVNVLQLNGNGYLYYIDSSAEYTGISLIDGDTIGGEGEVLAIGDSGVSLCRISFPSDYDRYMITSDSGNVCHVDVYKSRRKDDFLLTNASGDKAYYFPRCTITDNSDISLWESAVWGTKVSVRRNYAAKTVTVMVGEYNKDWIQDCIDFINGAGVIYNETLTPDSALYVNGLHVYLKSKATLQDNALSFTLYPYTEPLSGLINDSGKDHKSFATSNVLNADDSILGLTYISGEDTYSYAPLDFVEDFPELIAGNMRLTGITANNMFSIVK